MKLKVSQTGWNQVSSLGIAPLNKIFLSEKFRETHASSFLLKMLERKSQKVVEKARFLPVFDCFSAQEASPSVGTVWNRFYVSNCAGCDWNLEIFLSIPNREKSTGVTWTKFFSVKIGSSPVEPKPRKLDWKWPAECDFPVGKAPRVPCFELSIRVLSTNLIVLKWKNEIGSRDYYGLNSNIR